MNLKNLLKKPLSNPPKWAGIAILVIGIIGFADATYLTVEHFRGGIPPCGVAGCEEVLTSEYAVVAGLPVALLGAVYYAIMAILALLFLDTKRELFLRIATFFSIAGLLSSLWFVFVQAFLLNAYCLYCLFSALTSFVLFGIAVAVWKRSKHFSHLPMIIEE